jgi:signal transduction histidine kinase
MSTHRAPVRRRPRPSITQKDLVPDLGVAAGTVAVTAALHFLMLPWLGEKPPLILFAVMAAALTTWRGLGPGMLATSLGTPVGSLLIQPQGTGAAQSSVPIEFSLMFSGSLFICWLIYRVRTEQEYGDAVHEEKDSALAFVSHELRQPLANVHLAAAMLERDRSDETRDRAAALIIRSAARLTKVVEDLVDVTRLQGGGLRVEPSLMRLQDSILAASDALSPAIVQRQQYLQIDSPLDPPIWVNGDASRLQQVFDNLLSNASKYSPEGAEISISARGNGGRAEVVVRDSGIGIRRDMLERVFDPFVRESHTSAEGLGIGLALVRNLVLNHGGTITAHSDGPGRGSAFVVELPLVPGPVTSHEREPFPAPSATLQRVE